MKKLQLFLIAVLILTATFTAFAEDATFETITDALNYSGNRNAVTSIIITGTISGNDYSDESE
jgi:hypothetical protein